MNGKDNLISNNFYILKFYFIRLLVAHPSKEKKKGRHGLPPLPF